MGKGRYDSVPLRTLLGMFSLSPHFLGYTAREMKRKKMLVIFVASNRKTIPNNWSDR